MRAAAASFALATAIMFVTALPQATPAEAQQERRAAKQKSKKQAKRSVQNKPASAWSSDGIPSCNSGILWVDSQCRRADGKICMVGEEDLHNCI